MSIRDYARHEFLKIKSLPEEFDFYVISHLLKDSRFHDGPQHYLLGQVIQDYDGPKEGLLRISPTTASTFPAALQEWDDLKGLDMKFAWDEGKSTIVLKEWSFRKGPTMKESTSEGDAPPKRKPKVE